MQGYIAVRAHGGIPPWHRSAWHTVPPSFRWLSAGITDALTPDGVVHSIGGIGYKDEESKSLAVVGLANYHT
jgi:hypothetical protein